MLIRKMCTRKMFQNICHLRLKKSCSSTLSSDIQTRTYCDSDNSTSANERLTRLKVLNKDLYPSEFSASCDVGHVLDKYQYLEKAEVANQSLSVGGMIISIRESGKKIKFIDMVGNGDKIQLKLHSKNFSSFQQFEDETNFLTRGDRIGVIGKPCRTKTGELSIDCSKVELLAPCLRKLPHTLTEGRKKLTRRYVDFLTNQHLRNTLHTRSKIIKRFRTFFESQDFIEVETPILSSNVGGASATPFITYHKELKSNLYLRVAPELYLKQLIVAGFDRVFEIGKLFRNEGVDNSHNPEFTSCEFYMAYATYTNLMLLTHQLFSNIVKELNLKPMTSDGIEIDFISAYKEIEFLPSLEQAIDKDLPTDILHHQDTVRYLLDICKEKDIVAHPPHTTPRLLDTLFSKLIEPSLIQPTFVTKHPMVMSPLAKPDPKDEGKAQRFELFAAGLELCNAYTEMNDPNMQRVTLAEQSNLADPEAMLPDEQFCVALEYGMPPTAGWGCGIDRLTAILTNNDNIKNTITFPLSKALL